MKRWRLALLACALLLGIASDPIAVRADGDEDEEAPAAETEAYEPRTLEPSWRDQAEAAYGKKAYADAIFLYRKWLEADPRDDTSWYNLACSYALIGQEAAALDAFEAAVDAGWKDAAWPRQDTDLETVRDDPRFDAALERCVTNADKDGPSSYVRHWMPIPAIGTYIALLPPDYETSEESYPLVVILHGNGSSEMGHGKVGDGAGREGVIYVVPRAPYPHEQVFQQMRRPGWTWVPQDADGEAIEPLLPAPRYVDSVLAAVDDARARYRVKGEKFFVFGHSMGGWFANTLAMLHADRVEATFAYAGGLWTDYLGAEFLDRLKAGGVKAWHVHGNADPVVEPRHSKEAHAAMEAAGIDSSIFLFDDVDHGIGPPVRTLLQRWVREIVRGLDAEDALPPPAEGE